MKLASTISIGQLATRTGLAVSAIRYYEEQGLVAQQFGFSLEEVRRELAKLPNTRTPTKRDWERIGNVFGKALDQKIDALQQLRARLNGCIGCGCLSLEACKLYNPQDRARRLGAGPRYLMGDRPDV